MRGLYAEGHDSPRSVARERENEEREQLARAAGDGVLSFRASSNS